MKENNTSELVIPVEQITNINREILDTLEHMFIASFPHSENMLSNFKLPFSVAEKKEDEDWGEVLKATSEMREKQGAISSDIAALLLMEEAYIPGSYVLFKLSKISKTTGETLGDPSLFGLYVPIDDNIGRVLTRPETLKKYGVNTESVNKFILMRKNDLVSTANSFIDTKK